jgi:ergothioneine biosynthesis protein EgtB
MMLRNVHQQQPNPDDDLARRYSDVRQLTHLLAAPLSPEDQCIQSMADASPVKWHLGHTTWFFETMLLIPYASSYEAYDPRYHYLFNSYYESLGARHPRPERGLITRPSSAQVIEYRRHVDAAMARLLADGRTGKIDWLCELGLQHEQQHQELILTDIKHALSNNPLFPAYGETTAEPACTAAPLSWRDYAGGIYCMGSGDDGFAFDNEQPRHRVLLQPFRLASRLVTCGEFLGFIESDGYRRPEFWLSDGWSFVQSAGIRAPHYWTDRSGRWHVFRLNGLQPLNPDEPVVHISFYEADAYARWSGKRLPTEFEWEAAAANEPLRGNFLDRASLHPKPAGEGDTQFYGDAWEWTRSAYEPYPGYKPWEGIASEYNGKFMCSQIVLRGGSCATPADHIRPGYRNFFPPSARWQFSGIRLAEDA